MSRRRRQEEREGRTRESVRVSTKSRSGGSVRPSSQSQHKDSGTQRQRVSSSDGVRFTDLASDPLHRSKQGSEGQGRHHSGEYREYTYRGVKERERTRGGQRRSEARERRSVRSRSVEKEEEVEVRGTRRGANKENRHSVHYDGQMERQKERSAKMSSRSKSHDIAEERRSTDQERRQRRQYEAREGSSEHYGESQESYQAAPFYLHSSQSQVSSHYGYERIQSLFYGSTEQIQQENAKLRNSKTEKPSRERSSTRHRESSPKKSRDGARKQSNNDPESDQRQRSPRRRAAPAMPLPPAPSGPGKCRVCASLQLYSHILCLSRL